MKGFRYLVLSAAFLAIAAGFFAAEAADTEPLAGNYTIFEKDRITLIPVKDYNIDVSLYTLTSDDASATAPNRVGGITLPGDTVALASVAGYVNNGNLDFYGTTLPNHKNVVVTVYMVTDTGGAIPEAGKYDLRLSIMDENGSVLKNSNSFNVGTGWGGTGAQNVPIPTTSPGRSFLSLVTDDWNDDGYSDYILTIPTFTGAAGSSSSTGTYTVSSVYVDGKTLYDKATTNTGGSSDIPTDIGPDIGTTHALFSGSSRGDASFSVSTAVGDIDGDGKKEFIAYYSIIVSSGGTGYDNFLDIYSIAPSSGGNATFTRRQHIGYASQVGYGGSGSAQEVLAVTAGDFDGDGKDDIALLYSGSGNMYLSVTPGGAVGSSLYAAVNFYPRWPKSTAKLTALAADLDGDGKDELIWDHPDNNNKYNLHIHSWPNGNIAGGSTNTGTRVDFPVLWNYSIVDRSLAVMDSNVLNDPEKRLAAIAGGSRIAFAVVPASAFKTNGSWRDDGNLGTSSLTYLDSLSANHFALAAVDLFGESTIFGEPTEFTLTAQVKPRAIIQAPPKHWDVIESGGVSVTADAFSLLTAPSSAVHGYEVDFSSSATSKTITTTTNSSSFTVGENVSATVTAGNAIVKDSVDVGLKAAQSKMDDSTDSETKTTTVSFTTAAHDDDQLYYTETDYTLWRYPILWPSESRFGSDGGQQFVQYIVPTTVDSTAISTPGKNVSWYEPLFDTYNLFTYPRSLKQIEGYPDSANKPGGSSWASLNGKLLFSFGSNILIGNGDLVTATVTQADDVSATDKTNVSTTLSVTESDTLEFNTLIAKGKVTVGSNQDWASSSAQTGTTDVSNMETITLFWPGGSSYKSPGNFTLADQQFYVSGGAYTQDDGTLRVAFAVPTLENIQGSNLWGGSSPYMTIPDPGLLLPWRYTWSGGTLVANTASNAKQIRGVDFSNYSYNVLPTGATETVTFRVFNYSFRDAAACTFDVYYQTMSSGTDLPDITKATKVLSGQSVPAIPGRSNNASAPDNWKDVSFQWKTPAAAGNGFLHIVLNPAGTQLSTTNDSGYIEVGIYDASQFFSTTNATNARGASAMVAREALTAEGVRLRVDSMTVKDEDGNALSSSSPLDGPIEIATTVRLDGPAGTGLPLVKVNLYVDGIPAGSKHVPYLASGQSRTVTIYYDPSDHAAVKPSLSLEDLSARVFSEATGFSRDGEDPLSHQVAVDNIRSTFDDPPSEADNTVAIDGGSDGKIVKIKISVKDGSGSSIPPNLRFRVWLFLQNGPTQNASSRAASDSTDYFGPFMVKSTADGLDIDVDNLQKADGTKGSIPAGSYIVKFADIDGKYVGTTQPIPLPGTASATGNSSGSGCDAGYGLFGFLLTGFIARKSRKA